MAGKYDHLDRDTLIRLLERRDADRQLGLVWEREELETDKALNDDYVALDLDPQLSHGEGPWPNLIIEGDNYDALRALRATHKGKIRCIYIDPPYNTGNRDFVYNDRFVDKTHRFRHSLWLEFMYQRLRLAKELLSDDGVIFVSIDDNEVFRLGMLMEHVFGDNLIEVFSWVRTRTPAALSRKTKKVCEYVICYETRHSSRPLLGIEKPAQSANTLLNQPNPISVLTFPAGTECGIPDGEIKAGRYGSKNYQVDLLDDVTVLKGRFTGPFRLQAKFRWSQNYLESQISSGVLVRIPTSRMIPSYEKDSYGREALPNLIDDDVGVGTNENASSELRNIFKESIFDYPKPTSLVKYLVGSCTSGDDIIVDFFAGSGTTAHAVSILNSEDGGNRKFILVSSTEATEDQPDKNICRDVCSERVRRIMTGYPSANGQKTDGLGGSFAYLRTRRVPKHRLSHKLAHGEIWNALELTHGCGVTVWPGTGFSLRTTDTQTIAYLADFNPASIAALMKLADSPDQTKTILYSWAPDRVREILPHAQHQPVPQFLRDRFGGRGN